MERTKILDVPELEAAFDTLRLSGMNTMDYQQAMCARTDTLADSADNCCEGCREERGRCDQRAIVRGYIQNDQSLYCQRHMQMAAVDWQALGFAMPFQRLDDGRIFTLGKAG